MPVPRHEGCFELVFAHYLFANRIVLLPLVSELSTEACATSNAKAGETYSSTPHFYSENINFSRGGVFSHKLAWHSDGEQLTLAFEYE